MISVGRRTAARLARSPGGASRRCRGPVPSARACPPSRSRAARRDRATGGGRPRARRRRRSRCHEVVQERAKGARPCPAAGASPTPSRVVGEVHVAQALPEPPSHLEHIVPRDGRVACRARGRGGLRAGRGRRSRGGGSAARRGPGTCSRSRRRPRSALERGQVVESHRRYPCCQRNGGCITTSGTSAAPPPGSRPVDLADRVGAPDATSQQERRGVQRADPQAVLVGEAAHPAPSWLAGSFVTMTSTPP